jgi:hypothetical protein
LKIGRALNALPISIVLRFEIRRAFAQTKKPMRITDPHRQYAFSQSAGTTLKQ